MTSQLVMQSSGMKKDNLPQQEFFVTTIFLSSGLKFFVKKEDENLSKKPKKKEEEIDKLIIKMVTTKSLLMSLPREFDDDSRSSISNHEQCRCKISFHKMHSPPSEIAKEQEPLRLQKQVQTRFSPNNIFCEQSRKQIVSET